MGILDNFRKIGKYMSHTRKERELQNEVIHASVEDNSFYVEYSAFVEGLEEKLTYLLETEGYKTIQFTPNTPSEAKYFLAVMQDSVFTNYYHMEKTVAGDFQFSHLVLDIL